MTTTSERTTLAATISATFTDPSQLERAEAQLAVEETIDGLDRGEIRLAEKFRSGLDRDSQH